MKHLYIRTIYLFVFSFFVLGVQQAFAYSWRYYIGYNQTDGRIYITAAVDEDDCTFCDDNTLAEMNIDYSLDGGANYYSIMKGASRGSRMGWWTNGTIFNNGSSWVSDMDEQRYYINVPASWIGKTVKIRTYYNWGDDDDPSGTKYNDFTIPGIAAPAIASTSSNGEQNGITVNWNEANANGYPTGNIKYELLQNGVVIATLNYGTTSYTVNNTSDKTKYSYQVRVRLTLASGGYYYNTGTAKDVWKNPKLALTPSYASCDTGVKLTWAAPLLDNTYKYKITRSSRSDFSAGLYTFNISDITSTSYFDNSDLGHQVTNYYKIEVLNASNQVISALTSSSASIVTDFLPATPAIALTNNASNFVLSWSSYSCSNITDFELVKKTYQGNSLVNTQSIVIAKGTLSYTDNDLQACNTYEYQLKARNSFANAASNIVKQAVSDNIADAFAISTTDKSNPQHQFYNHDYRFKASKGFYTNYVQLQWDANYKSRIQSYNIYRKIAGATSAKELIKVVEGGSATIWTDEYTEANTIYEYTIEGVATCDGQQIQTTQATALGFRSPYGNISGRITFTGGQGVENVEVRARNTEGAAGKAIKFKDTAASLDINASAVFWPSEQGWAIEAWLRPDNATQAYVLYDHLESNSGLKVYFDGTKYNLQSGSETLSITPAGLLKNNEFTHIAVSLNTVTREVKWVVNDSVFTVQQLTNAFVRNTNLDLPLYIGNSRTKNAAFKGVIDEVRVWSRARTSAETVKDHSRYLTGGEAGLVAYWKADEGFGSSLFDGSKFDRKYNENHGKLSGSYEWTSTIPTESQLANVAYTDAKGDYKMTGIQFRGSGETYELTPMLGVHQFDPSSMQLFVGEGSLSHNGKDFKDVSSFIARGTVLYKGTSFPVQGVQILVDGKALISADNAPVVSDAKGEFEAQVPIGKHTLSFIKNGHVFANAYWPEKNKTFDFQEHLRGSLEIEDTTKVLLVGRVAGGQIEEAKPLGMGLSTNNIGKTVITLESEKGADLDNDPLVYQKTIELTTDQNTGEYSAWIIPEKFIIKSIATVNTKADGGKYSFGPQPILDLSLPVQNFTWEYKLNESGAKVDSAKYHFAKKFILHTQPQYDVNDGKLIGEQSIKLDENTPAIDLSNQPLGYPVFKMGASYSFPLSFFEEYENADSGEKTRVPITNATIRLNNNLKAGSPGEDLVLSNNQGVLQYTFKAGTPNLTAPYTSDLAVAIKIGEQPYTSLSKKTGYVLGQVTSGSGFLTKGPDLVEFVLRDPPGSGSYSFIAKGSGTTKSLSVSRTDGSTQEINPSIKMGMKTEVSTGLGVALITTTEAQHTISNQEIISEKHTNDGEFVETIEITEEWQTSANPDMVGSDADLFVGRAMNFIIGKTENLELLPIDGSFGHLPHSTTTFNFGGKEYALVRRQGIAAAQDNFNTRFMYSQYHIENNLIPELKKYRNSLFTKGDGTYVSNLNIENEFYGADNYDSLAFPTSFLKKTANGVATRSSYNGPSYKFTPKKLGDPDSVYLLNQQITLWEKALRDNEKNKLDAKQSGSKAENASFDGGTTYTWEKSLNSEWGTSHTFEVTADASLEGITGGEINGFGLEIRVKAEYNHALAGTTGETQTKSMTYGYVFSDGDKGDYFSVDVIDPSKLTFTSRTDDRVNWEDYYELRDGQKDHNNGFYSPMFYTRGGQSSCPYEGGEQTKYYQKGKDLNAATLQREKPEIAVENPIVTSVPENNAAVFRLRLKNNSESEEDMWYGIQIDEASNQSGAILQIDGASPNRAFNVPYGKTIEKILTIKKGPGAVFEYENIGIILSSLCQPEEIADTVLVSAYFEPACTPVKLVAPLDNWLANVDSKGVLPITVNGYDVNLSTFQRIELQYKSTASNTWATIQTYYNREDEYNSAIDRGEKAEYINNKTTITYEWKISDLPDRNYEIRAVSFCADGSVSYSDVSKGLKDELPPLVFGTPQPADGILSPNDEIMIQFAEPVEAGLISKSNISVRGVLNGSDRAHGSFLTFDGQQAYVKIPEGLRLDNRSFTVEFWSRTAAGTPENIVFTQGDGDEYINIGFDAAGKLYTEWSGNTRLTATTALASATWNHYAISFDAATGNISLYGNDKTLAESNYTRAYEGIGQIFVGKSFNDDKAYNGDLYALRVWDVYKSRDEVYALQSKLMNGTERGLVGAWPMNDLTGTGVKDVARALHGMSAAQWVAEPASKALKLTGDGYISVPSGHTPITRNTDFTLEFWFKAGANAKETTLFSASLVNTDMQWSLDIDNKGGLFLKQQEVQFKGVDDNVLDNKWHHLAMVTDRRGNLSFYLDGELKNSRKANTLANLTAPALYFGARYAVVSDNGTPVTTIDRNYNGNLDEIRLWNSARTAEQIKRNMRSKLADNLSDLQLYIPFEAYANNSGVMVSVNSAKDFSGKTTNAEATFVNATYTAESPLIDRPQPEQKVNFNYVVNQDKILITLNEPAALVEKTILDITVQGIMDKNSNAMQGAKTWSVFVDKNQVKWANTSLRFEKQLYEPLTFEVEIVNMGGSQENFSIEGLPGWLTPQPATGTIEPNSRKTIKFVVQESLNIGNYAKDLFLRTSFGYDEKLALDLKVFAVAPKWAVDPSKFDKSMSVTGQIKINGRFSTNPDDKVVALVNGEVRGVAQPKYVAGYDRYMFFMDVYGNVNETEQVKFNIWNASLGVVHTDVTPASVTFRDGEIYGSPTSPFILSANNEVYQDINLKKGWNWVSFNVNVTSKEISEVIDPALLNTNSILMSQQWTADYSGHTWSPPGKTFTNTESYLLKVDNEGLLRIKGGLLNPDNERITLKKGWNWLGYTPQASMPVKDALAGATLNSGDIIKGQTGFAIYDSYMGWIGSLNYLKGGEGYRIKSTQTSDVTFTFPKASVNSGRVGTSDEERALNTTNQLYASQVQPHSYKFNMSLVAEIASDNVQEGMVVLASNTAGESIGWGVGRKVNGKVLFFVTIYGNQEAAEVNFAYHNAQGNYVVGLKEKVSFRGEQVIGTLETPYLLNAKGAVPAAKPAVTSTKVYPNPFSDKLSFAWVNTPGEQATLELLDITGRKLQTIFSGVQDDENGQFVWEGSALNALPAGMYIIRLTHAHSQEIIRVVKK